MARTNISFGWMAVTVPFADELLENSTSSTTNIFPTLHILSKRDNKQILYSLKKMFVLLCFALLFDLG